MQVLREKRDLVAVDRRGTETRIRPFLRRAAIPEESPEQLPGRAHALRSNSFGSYKRRAARVSLAVGIGDGGLTGSGSPRRLTVRACRPR
jgi:hypothetical protein